MSKSKNPKLKKPYLEVSFTQDNIQELFKCSRDPIYFIENYVYIKGMYGKGLFKLFPYQKDVINNYQKHDRNIVMMSRQNGKSELAAAYILWFICFHTEKTVLVTSYRSENSKEIILKIVYGYEELPDWLRPGIDTDSFNKTSIVFENKCKVIADTTSENSGRGLTIDLLYVDEFAHIKSHLQQNFFTSVLPTLSSRKDGKMIITSTPNGDIDLFSQLWRGAINRENNNTPGINGFLGYLAKWSDVPGRGIEWKNKIIAQFGETRWNQEFECMMISSDHTLIDTMVLNNLTKIIESDKPAFKINDLDFWKQLSKRYTYIVGIDTSEGSGEDYSVIQVFEFPSLEQIAEYRTNTTSPAELYGYLKNLLRYLEHYGGEIYCSYENNAVGQALVALYESDPKPPENTVFVDESGKNKRGIATTSKSKIKTCLLLKEMIIKGQMKIHSQILLNELKSYVRKAGSYAAQTGSTDDCIAATLIVLRIVEEMASFDDNAYNKMYTAGLQAIEDMEKGEWKYDENDINSMPMPMIFI